MDDIGHLRLYLSEEKYREVVNRAWLEAVTDPDSRPARHAMPALLRHGVLFQIEVIAVLRQASTP
jgi:2-iminobutanoate/2-iminopropanoate deaminase